MKALTTEQQAVGFLFALRARSAIRDMKPADPEALAAASYVVALVAPELAELNQWEREHGLTVTDVEAYNAMVALVGADIVGGPVKGETQH